MLKGTQCSRKISVAGIRRGCYASLNKPWNRNSLISASRSNIFLKFKPYVNEVKSFSSEISSSIRIDHFESVNKIKAQYELGAYFISLDKRDNQDDDEVSKEPENEAKSAENAQEVISEIKALRKRRIREKKAQLLHAAETIDNFAEGIKLLMEASAGGSAEAYCLLGNLYLEYLNDTNNVASVDDIVNRVSVSCNKYFQLTHRHNRRQIVSKCIEYYTNACAADSSNASDAYYNLGNIYYSGFSNHSRQYYEHQQSLDDTSTDIDVNHLDQMILVPNYKLSMEYFERAGDASALFWMGYCYYSGGIEVERPSEGITTAYSIDYKLARKYLEQASQLGHDQADYYLALLSSEEASLSGCGSGVDCSVDAMEKYYYLSRSILLYADVNAIFHLASLCHQLYFKDIDIQGKPHSFTCTCEQCSTGIGTNIHCRHIEPHVIVNIIDQLLDGQVIKELQESLLTVSLPMPTDSEDAISCTAQLIPVLEFHDGIKRLNDKAIPPPTTELVHKLRVGTLSLYEKAVSLGSSDAATALGSIYFHGIPSYCEKDQMKAYQYYNMAAEQGDSEAWRNIISMFIHGHGVPKSLETAQQMMSVMFPDEPALVIPNK